MELNMNNKIKYSLKSKIASTVSKSNNWTIHRSRYKFILMIDRGRKIANYKLLLFCSQVGDRVFCGLDHGGYAEYAAANVYECYPLSENLTFAQGASLYVAYFAAYRGLVAR